ncbi:MAG TPA: hypothetical protein VMV77_21415 [Bacteroidales bacterium]|nr:hypothetical protein [Bacteroidales bacterium]
MTNKVKIVLKGFVELTDVEKKEFLDEIKKYLDKNTIEKGIMNESLGDDVKRILGPTSTNHCPCCGK